MNHAKKTPTFLFLTIAMSAAAWAQLEELISTTEPSPVPGETLVRPVDHRWDACAIPIEYRVNDAQDPIANPNGPAFLTLAEATQAFQDAFDSWNQIPTSFIEFQIAGATTNTGAPGLDFINELTFGALPQDVLGRSDSFILPFDLQFPAGADFDGDGDADVSAAIASVQDVDGDGDLEYPAGFFAAGTILDNDVIFNNTATGATFTTAAADADASSDNADLVAVAVHEFGHSHGLSHSSLNNTSATDGSGATMYPTIDSNDPDDQLAVRTLHPEDIAYSSFFYPEGSANTGPAALQAGDIAFDRVYGVITGEVTYGPTGDSIAGASVSATDFLTGEVVVTGVSGEVVLTEDADGNLGVFNDPAIGIVNGTYQLPVPRGFYHVGVEALDGDPVGAEQVNFTSLIGATYGFLDFEEEFWNFREGALGDDAGRANIVSVRPGRTRHASFVTNVTTALGAFDGDDGNLSPLPAGAYLAVRIPRDDILNAFGGARIDVHGFTWKVNVFDNSTVPAFEEAMITDGVLNADGTATLALNAPIYSESPFIAQDEDFAPFYLPSASAYGSLIFTWLRFNIIEEVFIVLRVSTTTPFPGASQLPPIFPIDLPGNGNTFFSPDGATFFPQSFNALANLIVSER